MKYIYYYQTAQNEKKEGEIKARNRAEAYAAIRRSGIRPYRVVGDDPPAWRERLGWIVSMSLAAILLLVVGITVVFAGRKDLTELPRQQLIGDASFIAVGVSSDWSGALPTALDRFLAAYAQPGWLVTLGEVEGSVQEQMLKELATTPLKFEKGEAQYIHQLKRIILGMRKEMQEFLEKGGTFEDYRAYLDERQARECMLHDKAFETLNRSPESERAKVLRNLNIRMKDMGLAELPSF